MALIGDVAPPKFYIRRNQKLVECPHGPLSTLRLSFNHALPLVDSKDGIPVFGVGTKHSCSQLVYEAVKEAIKQGYRHIDCAQYYLNGKEVAAAIHECIAAGICTRKDLWITTKVWNTFHSFDLALASIKNSLSQMKLEYFDLVMIHWPMGFAERGNFFPKKPGSKSSMKFSKVDYAETYNALVFARKIGLTRHIGLANFGIGQIMRLIGMDFPKPQVIQVELHVYLRQKMMMEYCASQKIALIASSPLASPYSLLRSSSDPHIFFDKVITTMSILKNKTPNQHIAFRWPINHGCGIIMSSVKAKHIRNNRKVLKLMLNDSEMKKLDKLDKDKRFVDMKSRDGLHRHFPW